jgi:hypothetical protein
MPSERFIAEEFEVKSLDTAAQLERLRKALAKRKKAELIGLGLFASGNWDRSAKLLRVNSTKTVR